MKYTDVLIDDFKDARFQKAFRQYFTELGMNIKNWDALFAEMEIYAKAEEKPHFAAVAERERIIWKHFKSIMTP